MCRLAFLPPLLFEEAPCVPSTSLSSPPSFLPPLPSCRISVPSRNILHPSSAGAGESFVFTSPDHSLLPSSVSGTAHSCIAGRSGLVPRPGAPEGKSPGNGLEGFGGRREPQINGTSNPKVLRFQKAHSASPTDGENGGPERVWTSPTSHSQSGIESRSGYFSPSPPSPLQARRKRTKSPL